MKRLICFALILTLAAPLFGCGSGDLIRPATFYYHRTATAFGGSDGVLAPEQRELLGIEDDLGAILELYCEGPISDTLTNPLPPGTRVRSYTLKNGQLSLHFNDGLKDLAGLDLTLAAGCIARTFLELTDAESLVITADGTLLNGQTALRLTLEDLALRDGSTDRLHREVTVYYTDQNRRYLIGQEVNLAPTTLEELPMQLLNLMHTPPAELKSPLPVGTRLRSATVSNGVCTVDLSREFERRMFYSQTSQLLSLMAMVNTLTALPEIERVEFTVDGQPLIRYGVLSITEALSQDERFIGPVRTGLGERDVTLYLAHGEEGRLLSFPVRLGRSPSVSDAELILRHLLSDPGGNSIRTFIPRQTELLSLDVREGVCFVDLSRDYLDNPEDLAVANRVIAASLCTLSEVEQVQILVEGAVPEGFDGKMFGLLCPTHDWFL